MKFLPPALAFPIFLAWCWFLWTHPHPLPSSVGPDKPKWNPESAVISPKDSYHIAYQCQVTTAALQVLKIDVINKRIIGGWEIPQ